MKAAIREIKSMCESIELGLSDSDLRIRAFANDIMEVIKRHEATEPRTHGGSRNAVRKAIGPYGGSP